MQSHAVISLLRRAIPSVTVAAMALVGLPAAGHAQLRTTGGLLRGSSADSVTAYLGVPYAAAPTGPLRWKAPQPAPPWDGVRSATTFAPRCAQLPLFSDMIFRDVVSEDCLYLNVWTAAPAGAKRPVMFWIHGGGFQAGSGSEPRQDGSRLAELGVVVVNINYRLGVFGFLAHPELTTESVDHTSGNYGLLDMIAALRWVHDNIAAFGGDPANVTIFGESAGSFAVSALVASPLSQGLVHKAIGESGALFGQSLQALDRTAAEVNGRAFAQAHGAPTLAALRAMPMDSLLSAVKSPGTPGFSAVIDGVMLPRAVPDIYAAGEQHRIPLLAGWNADEIRSAVTLAKIPTTAASFAAGLRARYGANADLLLQAYTARSDSDAVESAAALISDQFIGHATWRWVEAHQRTSRAPTWVYRFSRQIPIPTGDTANGKIITSRDIGARHAGEIEYVFGALPSVPRVTWEPADRALSETMMKYWTNFAKRGDPNGPGLPRWPKYEGAARPMVQWLDATIRAERDPWRARYEALDNLSAAPTAK
jgi:para-nitrobenzyl esterase